METRQEYLERYLTWLRIQKGKLNTEDTRNEIMKQISRVKTEINNIKFK